MTLAATLILMSRLSEERGNEGSRFWYKRFLISGNSEILHYTQNDSVHIHYGEILVLQIVAAHCLQASATVLKATGAVASVPNELILGQQRFCVIRQSLPQV